MTIQEQIRDGIQDVLDDVQNDYENTDLQSALSALEILLEEHHTDHYTLERAPDGTSWPALSPVTEARKGSNKILVELGDMLASLISKTGTSIRQKSVNAGRAELIYGTADEKAAYHQRGTDRIPQREHVGMSELFVDDLEEGTADAMVQELMA